MPLNSHDMAHADDAGLPPEDGWLAADHRGRLDELIGQLNTSSTRESVSRYHAMAEGYLLGLRDCNHVSAEHHDAVRQYLHTLAIDRLKRIKPNSGKVAG